MRQTIQCCVRKLESLSTLELSRSAERLVSRERRLDAALIAHLAEISRRKGHLELGYGSLFEYCQARLGLGDGGAVWRRTQVAGVARRFPQVLSALADGRVNLSVLAILAAHLSEENVDSLLAEVEGKTTRQVKEIVSGIRPKPEVKSAIRRMPMHSGESRESVEAAPLLLPPPPEEVQRSAGRDIGPAREPEKKQVGNVEVARPAVYNFRFSGGKRLREKLERLGEVLGIANAAGRMPEIIEKALDIALDKKDPKRKLERRRKREATRARARPDEGPGERKRERSRRRVRERSRYIPSSVRERLLERAGYRCEYRGPDGVRCTARARLEVDHIDPFGKRGSGGEENLRVFCRAHNLLAAEREFGGSFMRGKIEGRHGRRLPIVASTG